MIKTDVLELNELSKHEIKSQHRLNWQEKPKIKHLNGTINSMGAISCART